MGISLKALLRRGDGDRAGDKVAKLPLGGGDAANDLLDVVYHSILDGSRKAVRLSMDATVTPSYTLLVARRERKFVTYAKKTKGGYATSYDMTDYVLAPYPDARNSAQVYRFSQNETGKMSLYQMPTADASEGIPLTSGRVSYALDPICAWIHGSEVFLVTNIPSESTEGGTIEQRVPVPRDRYATASGYLCVMRIDAISGRNRPVFETSEDVRNYCATVIPHRGSGRPGLLVYNTMFPKPKKETLPTSFEQLADSVSDKDEPIAPPRDIPIGASIYDFEMGAFARVPLDGRPEWGIDKIEFAEDSDADDENEPPRMFVVREKASRGSGMTAPGAASDHGSKVGSDRPDDGGITRDRSAEAIGDADTTQGDGSVTPGGDDAPATADAASASSCPHRQAPVPHGAHYRHDDAASVSREQSKSDETGRGTDSSARAKGGSADGNDGTRGSEDEQGHGTDVTVDGNGQPASPDDGQAGNGEHDAPSGSPEVMAPISIPAFLEASRGRNHRAAKGKQRRGVGSGVQLTEDEIRGLEAMGILRREAPERPGQPDTKEATPRYRDGKGSSR